MREGTKLGWNRWRRRPALTNKFHIKQVVEWLGRVRRVLILGVIEALVLIVAWQTGLFAGFLHVLFVYPQWFGKHSSWLARREQRVWNPFGLSHPTAMDRRTQFHFRNRDFVRGRPVARYNTARFLFGENRPSRGGLIRLGGARPGFFKRFPPVGCFGVPYCCMRMALVYRLLPLLVVGLLLTFAAAGGTAEFAVVGLAV